jgi:hypothetical protein
MRTRPPSPSFSTAANACCLLVMLAAAACATQGVADPAEAPTMDTVFAQVLEPRCTFSSCHSAPTVAARLDLSRERACNALVGATSCLFPQRMLVVPSDPDDSFLMHKLTGTGLSEPPSGSCSSETNAPMPFGGSAIPDEEIALIRSWITAGAPCESSAEPITGTGSVVGQPLITSLTVDRAAPLAGEIITFTVTLDRPAPAGGQVIDLVAPQTAVPALSAPLQVSVKAGESQVTFDAYAERPTSLFTLTARNGDSSKSIQLRVAGVEVTEVLADGGADDHSQWIKLRNGSSKAIDLTGYRVQVGQTSYGLITVPLTGTLAAGTCLVVGDPKGTTPTDGSVRVQRLDFTPDLPTPTSGTQAAGFAVFDASAAPLGSLQPPVDTMLFGDTNDAQLLGVDALSATPACGTPPVGSSARRTGDTQCTWSVPQAMQCP